MPREKDPRLERAGVSGYNKPKRLRLLGLDNRESAVRVKPLSLRKIKPDASHLKLVMQRILQKVKCQQRTGQTRRSGSGRSI